MIKVRAHTCYLGKTGYASHAREFFRELSNHVDLRVRNYTWDDNPDYINDTDLSLIDLITLTDNSDKGYSDYPIENALSQYKWIKKSGDFIPDVDIVLMDTGHHYFYEEYNSKIKIAYTVWESTELPQDFFEQLLKFDYLWVVTEWHKEVAIEQGYPAHRIFVVNEGVCQEFIEPLECRMPEEENDGRFKFMFFGRWDYRKSVPEIIGAFLKAFPNDEPVDLILSADNPYSVDGMNSTEERLQKYGYIDPRIKVKHFVSREDYVSYLKNGNVMITCARSEGWNIPLIEAMSVGTPVIYSDWGAQLEFAKGKGNPVNIKEFKEASLGADLGYAGYCPGLYSEPDYEHLIEVIRSCYDNYEEKKQRAIRESSEIKEKYNWKTIGESGYSQLLKVWDSEFPKIIKEDECVVILSHADTKEKEELLKRSLVTLKRQGYFVIISSHISVSERILKMCDYFICETDNPIVTQEEYSNYSDSVPAYYMNYPDFDFWYSFDFNHGYAALRLILNGARLAKSIGFNKTHYINYDYVIDNELTLKRHSNLLEKNSVVGYRWDMEDSINSAFFSAINEDLLKSIEPIKSKSDYFKYPDITILEDFLYRILRDSDTEIFLLDKSDIEKGNTINSIVISSYSQIETRQGKISYIYLGEEKGTKDLYICLMSPDSLLEVKIIKKHKELNFSVNGYPMRFYSITKEELIDGISVSIPKYNKVIKYDESSKRAQILIKNQKVILTEKEISAEPHFNINCFDGPFIEIKNAEGKKFTVSFIDEDNGKIHYSTELGNNQWARCSIKYYVNWLIKIIDKSTGKIYEYRPNLEGKRVLILIESSSLGDNIAWFPHIEKFKEKQKCEVFVSTFKNELFKDNYPDLNFIIPGQSVENIHAVYRIGWFYDGNTYNKDLHPRDFKNIPMQSTTTDILGLEHTQLKPRIVSKDSSSPIEGDYITIGFHSTAQAKYWNNPTGWQEVVDWFNSKGIKCVMISIEGDGYMSNNYPKGIIHVEGERTLENAIRYIKNSKMFIGIGSGLSWLSWALDVPTVLISGFSKPYTEFEGENVIRIFNGGTCNGCFNRERLDPSDWNWCPDHKGTERQFECTKEISGKIVIDAIDNYLNKEILRNREKKYVTYLPQNRETPPLINVRSAWGNIPTIIGDIIERFKLDNNLCLEFGCEYGFSTSALAHYFKNVIGVDTFEGDIHSDIRTCFLKETTKNLETYTNINLIKSNYKDFIANNENSKKYDMIHIDIIHTYEDTYECGEWAVKHSNCVIFHDTLSFTEVYLAVRDLAAKYDLEFYNYEESHGLGILINKNKIQ